MRHLVDRDLDPSPLNTPPAIIDRDRGVLGWKKTSKVAIYAAGLGRDEAPLDDPSWTVWALNTVPPIDSRGRLRADCWFDIHQRVAQSADDLRWIAECPVPVVVPEDLMDAGPQTVRVPVARILERWPGAPLACTFAYQIAMAILDGFSTIGLYGVELAYGTARERTVEWACVSWWVGYAEALGVDVVRPRGTRLGRHPDLYGVEYTAEKEATEQYLELMDETAAADELPG